MVSMADAGTRRIHPDAYAAYGLAGLAAVAARFGVRFGTLALARPFTLNLAHPPERSRLLAILYAGHAVEAALTGTRHGLLVAARSPHFLGLQEALAGYTGTVDAHAVREARMTGLAIVRQPGSWTAIEALAERLAAGEMLGHLTARRIIRSSVVID